MDQTLITQLSWQIVSWVTLLYLNLESPEKKKVKVVPQPGDPSHVCDTMSSSGVSDLSTLSQSCSSSHSSHSSWSKW